LLQIALEAQYLSQVVQGRRRSFLISNLQRSRKALLENGSPPRQVALLNGSGGDAPQYRRRAVPVAYFAEHRQRLFQHLY